VGCGNRNAIRAGTLQLEPPAIPEADEVRMAAVGLSAERSRWRISVLRPDWCQRDN